MNPSDDDAKARKEREDTDARLQAERNKVDQELDAARASSELDADRIVEVARERAEQTIRTARLLADQQAVGADAGIKAKEAVEDKRSLEDAVVALESVVAMEQLEAERGERARALAALLRLEREATDEGLLVERARADEVVATRDEFLAIVSHDLRSLLGGIAMSAGLLAKLANADSKDGATAIKHTDRVLRFTARMNRLVGDLVDVVSLEAGKLHVEPQPDDAVKLVLEAEEVFQPSFTAKGLTLQTDHLDSSIQALFDHERIAQVLANLLSNALKFTTSGGVTMSVARAGSDVQVSVLDTGLGIPADQAEAVFERFRQVNRDRRGLGLGLYIAKNIVEAHGGRIWADRPNEGGTAVHFTLPEAPQL